MGETMARWTAWVMFTALWLLSPPIRAADDYPIQVILSTSGNAAFIGQMRQRTLKAMESLLNRPGNDGIDGRPVRFQFHDDQTSPQITVQITSALLAQKPAVLLGASITGTCAAELPLLRAGPVAYCFSPGEHPPPGSYMFSAGVSTRDAVAVTFNYFLARGWTHVATITSSDATGQEIEEDFNDVLRRPEYAKLAIVARTRFNLTDVSVAAQLERIGEAHPDVLIAWTTGTAVASVFKGMIQAGLSLPVVTSSGNMSSDLMRQFTDFLPPVLLIASPGFPEHDASLKLDPAVEAKQHDYYEVMRAAGLPVDFNTAGVWDATLLTTTALRTLGPQASPAQVRGWLSGLTGFAGIFGTYDFRRTPQRGLGAEAALMTRWDAAGQRWRPVSALGGEPL